jgi:SPP1 family phage portal protein
MEKLKYNFTGEDKEITRIIDNFKEETVPGIDKRNDYAKGNNPTILKRKIPKGSPGNKIPISYARRMINLVTGYMYKPGLVTYACDDQAYLEAVQEVFKYNTEPMETEQVGRQASIQGVGYELFFGEGLGVVEANGVVGPAKVMPRFVKVPANSIIPIYNYDIIPELTHFIRFYSVESPFQEEADKEYIEVYDNQIVRKFLRGINIDGLNPIEEMKHGFDRVPLVVYENNEDMIGDFSCVVPLIDAYDVLVSDSLNEFERFAWAYLILKGFLMGQEDVEEIKDKRTISLLNKDDEIAFLTKDINSDFVKFMSEMVRGEIHRQSGIPNLDDYKFGGNTSGETLSKWIYLMELFTDPKESYFKQALKRRIEIITAYQGLQGNPDDIEIIMSRNMPDKSMEQAELMEKYAGHISEKTLLENFADFVPDAEAEIEALKEERNEKAQVNLDMFEARQKAFGNNEEVKKEEGKE